MRTFALLRSISFSLLLASLTVCYATSRPNPYPNELSRLKFYSKYLYPLIPGQSVRSDVVKVLGTDEPVELDQWRIVPEYTFPMTPSHGQFPIIRLSGILITPKARVSMAGVKFPPAFTRRNGDISDASGGPFDVYVDRFGLAYWVQKGGDLYQIEYRSPR
jgi:hypothetical protein